MPSRDRPTTEWERRGRWSAAGRAFLPFVGVDGEAIDDRYVLLAAGRNHLLDRQGINLASALDWLAVRRTGRFVAFSFHYDICMMARDLPDKDLLLLMRSQPIRVGNWKITYYPRHVFKALTRGARVEVFDVWGFFQCSFEEALKRMNLKVPADIAWGKQARSKFSWDDIDRIIRYNDQECAELETMCDMLQEGMLKQRILIRSWHGPGAVASTVLQSAGVRGELERAGRGVEDLFARAYFGGRIETFKIGTMTDLKTMDINSAYPESCTHLWDQTKGEWSKVKEWEPRMFPVSLWHLEWVLPEDTYIGPLPYRRPDGRIYFPRRGRGWYWYPEAALAIRLHPQMRVLGGYVWDGPQETRLSSVIEDLYQRRLNLKADKRSVEAHVLKLALNSLYGKMAQSVGRAPWRSQAWAGYVTAYTRAKLRESVVGYERQVAAFATDGVLIRGAPMLVAEGERLGQWKIEHGWEGLVLGSGLYRLKRGKEEKIGIRGGKFKWDSVLGQLNARGYATIKDTVFVTPVLAILAPKAFGAYRSRWMERERTLAPWSDERSKRYYHYLTIKDWGKHWCDSQLVDGWLEESHPFEALSSEETAEQFLSPEEI